MQITRSNPLLDRPMHGEACVAELTATQYASLYNFGFTFRDMPGSVRHLRWFHPGRAPAMVHLLPTWNSYAYERGDVSFTSGMDRLRSSFHGRYQYNRTGPLGHDMLFIKFKWHGEVVDEECVPHTLLPATMAQDLCIEMRGAKWSPKSFHMRSRCQRYWRATAFTSGSRRNGIRASSSTWRTRCGTSQSLLQTVTNCNAVGNRRSA